MSEQCDLDDFCKQFEEKKEWHEAKEGEPSCLTCRHIAIRQHDKEFFNDDPAEAIVDTLKEQYTLRKLGVCRWATKMARQLLGGEQHPVLTQTNGHCLCYRRGIINTIRKWMAGHEKKRSA